MRIKLTVLLQARTLLRDIFQKSRMANEWILAVKTLWKTSVKVFKSSWAHLLAATLQICVCSYSASARMSQGVHLSL